MKLAAAAAIAAVVLASTTPSAHALTTRHAGHANARDPNVRVARAVNPVTQGVVNGPPCGETPNPVESQLAASGETPPVIKPPGPGAVQPRRGILDQNICDGTICVSLPAVAASIHKQLDGNVVGYAFFVGNALSGPKSIFDCYGDARTAADPPETQFTPDSKMQIASTSKVLTALATLKIMGSDINQYAFKYFPPSWQQATPALSPVRTIKVRRFISHTSGVMVLDTPAAPLDVDASLEALFTQSVNPNALFNCGGPPPIVVATQYCYSNVGFTLMRVVLPIYANAKLKSSDPLTLANTYVTQVWQNVFSPVGVNGVSCQKPASGYALGYTFPATQPGTDFSNGGDLRLTCGHWGWWISVKDYAAVLVSLNAQDGKILGTCGLYDMVKNPVSPLGWDNISDGQHRYLQKNGGDSWNGGLVSTSVVIYGGKDGCIRIGSTPIPGVAAVLFMNSNIKGANNVGADTVLHNALLAATTTEP